MSDIPRYPEPRDDNAGGREHGTVTSRERWRPVVGIVVAVAVVLLFVALHLTGAVGP